jgi:hypothetical protein
MAATAKRKKYIQAQLKVDKDFCPSKELFDKNLDEYYKAWKTFEAKSFECVEAYRKDLNYYNGFDEEDADPQRLQKKMQINTASSQISSTKGELKKVVKPRFYPHFHLEFEKLKERFPNWAEDIAAFDGVPATEFENQIGVMAKNPVIPRTLLDELRALPFAHPALHHLALPQEWYRELTRRYNEKRAASSANTPVAYLSEVKSYVEKVYAERNDDRNDFANPYLAVAFATGRRSIEIGLLTEFSLSQRPGHIHVSGLAKESDVQSLDIPVLFLAPQQVLELLRITRERIEKVLYGQRSADLKRIRNERNTRDFNDDVSKVTETFNESFEFSRLLPSEKLRDKATAHKATRGIYADVASRAVATMDGYLGKSNLEVRRMILGHKSQDTTKSYLDIQVIDDVNTSATIPMIIMNTPTEKAPKADTAPTAGKLGKKGKAPGKSAKKEKADASTPARSAPKASGKAEAKSATVPPEKEAGTFSAAAHRKFLAEAVNQKMTLAALDFSKKKRMNGIFTIQVKLHTFKQHPSLNDLAAIADEKSALAYVKFLDQQGIKHQIS